MSLSIDIAEPQSIVRLLEQTCEVDILPLNQQNFPDYVFTDADGILTGIEKESVSALLSNAAAIEDEIRRHWQENSRMILLVEGIALPHPDGAAVCELRGMSLHTTYFSKTRVDALVAWLWQVQENGIEYLQSFTPAMSAIVISSIYHSAQKAEHSTFRRHFKPRVAWHPNPAVMSLMGLQGADLGEKKATQLIEHFGSISGLCQATKEQVDALSGWDKKSISKLFRALGRE